MPSGGGELIAEFTLTGPPHKVEAPSLDAWLLERYRLFVKPRSSERMVAEVEHSPWQASHVKFEYVRESLGACLHLPLGDPAHAHHSPGVAATFQAFRRASQAVPVSAPRQPARAAERCAAR